MAFRLRSGVGAANRTVCLAVCMGALLLPAGAAFAGSHVLYAMENNDAVNQFTLTFPDLGLTTSSTIVATRYTIEVDDNGAAHFSDYYQLVESLALPLGINTGPIEIRIKSSEGQYDSGSQFLSTHDQYEITFANDLSGFGFQSPVVIDGNSSGTLEGGVSSARSMGLTWEGSGTLANPDNAAQPFKYTYTCSTSTRFGSPDTFPVIPSLTGANMCGAGTCGATGLAMMPLLLAGMAAMKTGLRRRTRR